MPKHVAFLRAINVGGRTVKMDQLRRLFERAGFSNIETFIASGNVIFDAPGRSTQALERTIEAQLRGALGYDVATFVRSIPELTAIAEHEPFNDSQLSGAHGLYVGFLARRPSEQAVRNLQSLATTTDVFHVAGREVYWLCRTTFSESDFSGALLEKTVGMPATIRNSTTVKKIASKYPPV